ILFGLSLLPIAYGGGLRMRDPTENIAFERKELTEALNLRRGQLLPLKGDVLRRVTHPEPATVRDREQ
ncbi:hypothetical protein, partial [Halorubrum sp. ASP1]|uniref:hypothetical protein n=1 Tax=Halorubrum sp. ASP1 TaxID=2518114 RepID=UPI001A7E0E4D